MAQYTIETSLGILDFLDKFILAVESGKRFKTVNFPESEKGNITTLYDYNFYYNLKSLNYLSGSSKWKVTFEDDAYVLPPNVVLPPLSEDVSIFRPLSSGRLGGGTLGALLMAIQHIIASGGFTGKNLTFPNKTNMPLFNYVIESLG